jgi:hypothetical protein
MNGVGYTVPAIVAVLGVCVLELVLLRTGLFRRPAYRSTFPSRTSCSGSLW